MNLIKRNSSIFSSLFAPFILFSFSFPSRSNKQTNVKSKKRNDGLHLNSTSVKIPIIIIIIILNVYYKSFTVDSISICSPHEYKSKSAACCCDDLFWAVLYLNSQHSQFILSINSQTKYRIFDNNNWCQWIFWLSISFTSLHNDAGKKSRFSWFGKFRQSI